MENMFPKFSADAEDSKPLTGNPILDHEQIDEFVSDISRGGERLITKMSNDMNRISIIRAMQMGYLIACQEHNLPIPEMKDPAKELGYGNV